MIHVHLLDKLELEGLSRVTGFVFTQWSAGFDAYKDLEDAAASWGSGPAF